MPKSSEICMTSEQLQRFFNFIMGDDLDFYEEYTIYLTNEEQARFFRDNPDFMSEFPCVRDRMGLLRNGIFRRILRKFSEYERV